MFYCFKNSTITFERLRLSGVTPLPNVGEPAEEIALVPPRPLCRMFRANEMPSEWFSDMRFAEGKEHESLPDMYAWSEMIIISQKMQYVIEEVDSFQHQYSPCRFFNYEGTEVDKGSYYHMVIRRKLEIEDSGDKPQTDFFVGSQKYLSTIQKETVLREYVEKLPIWQCRFNRHYIYLNQELVQTIKSKNLIGFEEYRQHSGAGEESLGHVW